MNHSNEMKDEDVLRQLVGFTSLSNLVDSNASSRIEVKADTLLKDWYSILDFNHRTSSEFAKLYNNPQLESLIEELYRNNSTMSDLCRAIAVNHKLPNSEIILVRENKYQIQSKVHQIFQVIDQTSGTSANFSDLISKKNFSNIGIQLIITFPKTAFQFEEEYSKTDKILTGIFLILFLFFLFVVPTNMYPVFFFAFLLLTLLMNRMYSTFFPSKIKISNHENLSDLIDQIYQDLEP